MRKIITIFGPIPSEKSYRIAGEEQQVYKVDQTITQNSPPTIDALTRSNLPKIFVATHLRECQMVPLNSNSGQFTAKHLGYIGSSMETYSI